MKNYGEVYFWVQGDLDFDCFQKLKHHEAVKIIPPSLQAYDRLLSENDLDYVGTRLHGGIYAMRHGKRAVIIAIDERAAEIHKCNHLNCITQQEIARKLEDMLRSEFETRIDMPFDEIERWKKQFEA